MDGWKYVSASGRKESGFAILKTRFRDCNLSRKQENKRDGMIERKQPFNRERKQSVFVERLKMKKKGSNQERSIFGITSATLLVWLTFRLNEKYGTHGLMKLSARKSHPFHIINRKAISRLFTKNQKQASK